MKKIKRESNISGNHTCKSENTSLTKTSLIGAQEHESLSTNKQVYSKPKLQKIGEFVNLTLDPGGGSKGLD